MSVKVITYIKVQCIVTCDIVQCNFNNMLSIKTHHHLNAEYERMHTAVRKTVLQH